MSSCLRPKLEKLAFPILCISKELGLEGDPFFDVFLLSF